MEQVKFDENFRMSVISHLNEMRTEPPAYATRVRKYIDYFKSNGLKIPGGEIIITQEGAPAYLEAAKFLDNLNEVEELTYNPGLTHAANDYLQAVEKIEEMEKISDLNIENFLEKHGEVVGHLAQSVDFGSSIPELVVINLVVGDGDPNRGNRKNLLDNKFKQIGVAKGTHKIFQHCTVLLYAEEFLTSKETLIKEEKLKEIKNNLKHDDNFNVPEGYKKIEKQEKIVNEKGVKKKITRIKKYKIDGSIETDLIKDDL